ncbi:MAG: sialidase family protein [Bryobacteraceae bacterium]
MKQTRRSFLTGGSATAVTMAGIASGETPQSTEVKTLRAEFVPSVPAVALSSVHDAREPVTILTASGAVLLAAQGLTTRSIVITRSEDGGATWGDAREVANAGAGNQMSAGAGGALPGGKLLLAVSEWNEQPGAVKWVSESIPGVHRYAWAGFRRTSQLRLLRSADDGRTWVPASCDVSGGPIAPAAMGRVIQAGKTSWLAVYGPANRAEMDAALSSAGLMRSDDHGKHWRFSHWVARADSKEGLGYGPGEVIILPNGRWLGILQTEDRGHGSYTRPRISRTISSNGGSTWSAPAVVVIGTKPSVVPLDGERLMLGTTQDRGIIFNVMLHEAAETVYQEHLWACIWYQKGDRGGTNLLRLKDGTILAAFHWMDPNSPLRCEVRTQRIQSRPEFKPEPGRQAKAPARQPHWVMAEAYQLPPIPDAPSGVRIGSLLRDRLGDWLCIGYAQTVKGGAHGFSASGLVVLRAKSIDGDWKKIAELVQPRGVVADTGSGSNLPGVLMQTRSGRLLLPFVRGQWNSPDRDAELLYSDDGGATWRSFGYIGKHLGLSPTYLSGAARIEQLENGHLRWLLHVGNEKWNAAKGDLYFVVSSDDGKTWGGLRRWARSQEQHYPELPYGRDGWVRAPEAALVNAADGSLLGIYREERGTIAAENARFGPLSMPHLCLTRGSNGGKVWTPSFGFLGVEGDMAVLPGGDILVAYREDCRSTAWISSNNGHTWQQQMDPAEMPWQRGAAEAHTQWPPGGESVIRVLDQDTAVVITDTGLVPSGKPLPPGFVPTREIHGRVQIRYFRRKPAGS